MRIGILGAGAIGCYLGGRLLASGSDVRFVGRLGDEIRAHGLTLTDFGGSPTTLPADRIQYGDDPALLGSCTVVLVTVKSMGTQRAARDLAPVLAEGATVVSFQNGVSNADVLRAELPGRRVLAGMVPFNVLRQPRAHFHLGTSGALGIERGGGAELGIAAALRRAGFEVHLHDSLAGVLYSKLLFNLNNSINALAGVPLREELSNRGYRRVLAGSMREGLACMKAARIRPVRFGRMIPRLAPHALELPDALFFRVAGAMIKIDADARSSMWEDLDRRRSTEIDYLNGEILRLGARMRVETPVNRAITELVKAAEGAKRGSPCLSAEVLQSAAFGVK